MTVSLNIYPMYTILNTLRFLVISLSKSYVALHADAVDLPRDVLVEVRAPTLRLVQIQVSVGFCCLYGQVGRHLKILHVRLPNHTSVFSIQYYFLIKQKFISRNFE